MYLHLGSDVVVNTKDIIGIFDMDNTSIGKATKKYLADCEKAHIIKTVSYEIPKSFIVCENDKKELSVYISQLSPITLAKRAEHSIEKIKDES